LVALPAQNRGATLLLATHTFPGRRFPWLNPFLLFPNMIRFETFVQKA
jgi:hypothetical protein